MSIRSHRVHVCLTAACSLLWAAHADAQDDQTDQTPPAEAFVPAVQPAPTPATPETHAEKVGWNSPHPVTENIYFQPGKGLTVESQDGLFKLQTRLRSQLLFQMDKADGESAEDSFELRRVRITFAGHWWGEDNIFKLNLALSPRDLGMTTDQIPGDTDLDDDNPILSDKGVRLSRSPVLDLYLQFKQLRDLNVRVGQYKIPFSRQRVLSSGKLMFVDRSIVNNEFNLDRDLGFDFRSTDLFGLDEKLRYYVGVYTGEGHSSFKERDVSNIEHFFGLNTLARVEVLPMGNFKDYSESDLERTPTPHLSLGASFAHVGNAQGEKGVIGSEPGDDGTTDFLMGEFDAMFKYMGLSAQTEFMIRKGDRNHDGDPGIALDTPRNGWGLTGQIGYLCSKNVEFALRQSAVRATGNSSLSDSNSTGVALNYYLAGQPYKIQADFFRYYGDSIRNGAYQFRTQLQVSL